ncbi:defensin-C-like [Ochlerotatus camptorhynchus]|uniref:defensin-C-like n=1 Tax=Ochlerotatus camptorhynchus TaxID=644619 RepID=UPI0031E44B83
MQPTTKVVCLALICLGAIVSIGSAFPQDVGALSDDVAIEYVEAENMMNIEEEAEVDGQASVELPDEEVGPQLRISCDVINGTTTFCALHCLARGSRGGYCNAKRVCVCRK